jgi:transposase
MFPNLLNAIRVPRLGPGRPRTRPDAVLADKAYSSRGNRALLRSRGITAVIAEPSDQIGHRKRKGSAGGRPLKFDAEAYKGRNVIERSFNVLKQWRGLATRYDKLALTYRGDCPLNGVSGSTRRRGRRGRLVTDDRGSIQGHEFDAQAGGEGREAWSG